MRRVLVALDQMGNVSQQIECSFRITSGIEEGLAPEVLRVTVFSMVCRK
jgi:hypothetical protein